MKNPYQYKSARWWFHEYLPQPWKDEAILAAKLFPIYPKYGDASEVVFNSLYDAFLGGFNWAESGDDIDVSDSKRFHYWSSIADKYKPKYVGAIPNVYPPEPEYNRAELIQLTAAALTGVLASNHIFGTRAEMAEIAVRNATAALDLINKK